MTQDPSWFTGLTEFTGRQVRRYRQLRDLSAEQLAGAVQAAGLPFTRSQVTNLEANRRTTITVGEVLVLAKVLDVPPILLVLPLGQQETVEVLPGCSIDTWAAAKWFVGEEPLPNVVDDTAWTQAAAPVGLYRDHDRFVLEWRIAQKTAAAARRRGSRASTVDEKATHEDAAKLADRTAQVHANTVSDIRHRMREQELTVPTLPEELDHLDESGLHRAVAAYYAANTE